MVGYCEPHGNPDENHPPRAAQQEFWDLWNVESRAGEAGRYESRLRAVALQLVQHLCDGGRPAMLEVGCGTGQMAEMLLQAGPVTGIDLSPAAIAVARRRCPQATFVCGDFYTAEVGGPFDVVLTADTIAHVPDQQGFIDRVAALLRRGGTFILMSQNSYALKRSSWVRPVAPGQIRRWPKVRELRAMLARDFCVQRVTTAAPLSATSGIFWLTNSRKVWAALCASFGERRVTEAYERLWLGSELVVIARRL